LLCFAITDTARTTAISGKATSTRMEVANTTVANFRGELHRILRGRVTKERASETSTNTVFEQCDRIYRQLRNVNSNHPRGHGEISDLQ